MAINLIDPNSQFQLISQQDDAILHESAQELLDLKEGSKTRFDHYVETRDASSLKFKDGTKPTLFVVKPILNTELVEVNERYISYDPVQKQVINKNRTGYYLDIFNKSVVGIQNEDGSVTKVTGNQVPLPHVVSIAASIIYYANVGQKLKNA